MKLEYKGLFDLNSFFKLIDAWLYERRFEKRTNKNFEHQTPKGKFIEWEIASWKKHEYQKYIIKVRVLMHELKKVDAVKDKKKVSLDQGRVLIYFDGFIEFDYLHYWDEKPFLTFLRTLYDKFFFKIYTERFEQRLTYDVHQLYHHVESFLNMYRHHKVVSKVPHFAH
jgi:hypothetical protein